MVNGGTDQFMFFHRSFLICTHFSSNFPQFSRACTNFPKLSTALPARSTVSRPVAYPSVLQRVPPRSFPQLMFPRVPPRSGPQRFFRVPPRSCPQHALQLSTAFSSFAHHSPAFLQSAWKRNFCTQQLTARSYLLQFALSVPPRGQVYGRRWAHVAPFFALFRFFFSFLFLLAFSCNFYWFLGRF